MQVAPTPQKATEDNMKGVPKKVELEPNQINPQAGNRAADQRN